jgi:hypothetical protein
MVRIIKELPYGVDREFIVSVDILVDDGTRADNETAYINAHSEGRLNGLRGTLVVFMNGYFAGQSREEEGLREIADRLYGAGCYFMHKVNGIEMGGIEGPKIL